MTPKHSKRRTSKLFLLVNTVLAWGLAYYSIYAGQGSAAIAASLGLIGTLYGAYVGVGHMDYRRFLNFLNPPENYDLPPQAMEGDPDVGSRGGFGPRGPDPI